MPGIADSRIKVLLVSAEVAPFAKAGGLADVAGALPKALNALGIDVRIVMPSYRMVRENPAYAVTEPIARFPVAIRPGLSTVVEIRKTSHCRAGRFAWRGTCLPGR